MVQFMDVHNGFIGVTGEQLREAHDRDLAIERDEGVHFERAWLDPVAGKVFCLATGPSKDAVLRIHDPERRPSLHPSCSQRVPPRRPNWNGRPASLAWLPAGLVQTTQHFAPA